MIVKQLLPDVLRAPRIVRACMKFSKHHGEENFCAATTRTR